MKKRILLGICGSIAAYKAPLVVRELIKSGYDVTTILTKSAQKFITPFCLENISESKCYLEEDLWNECNLHIQLARSHDLFLIAPISANTISKIAVGISDNLLTACFLAFDQHKVIVPSMHEEMISNKSIQNHLIQCRIHY